MIEIRNFTQNEIEKDFFEKIFKKIFEILEIKDEIKISLVIVGQGRMRALNKRYRGKNRVTDVLSFPYQTLKIHQDASVLKEQDFGEVVICLPQIKKQAKRAGHNVEKELTLIFTHGILHLLGYDHEKDESASLKMKNIENKILKNLTE